MPRKSNVFKDILKYVSREEFEKAVQKFDGDKWSKKFKYWDLFLVLLHGQLSGEMSLRMVGLSHNVHYAIANKAIPRSTLSDCCMKKKPAVLMEIFWYLVKRMRGKGRKLLKKINSAIQMIDATAIMLKGKGYEWVSKTGRIIGLKVHTVYDDGLESPIYFSITNANVNDIEEAEKLLIEPRKTYVFDKGYCDYLWWNEINQKGGYFVTRLKKSSCYEIKEKKLVKADNIVSDQIIRLTARSGKQYKSVLRYVEVETEKGKVIALVTNDLKSSAERIAELYKRRWMIELFFKCIKQNLKIKRFWGKTENAVKLQIIVAMIAYVLLRLIQMRSLTSYSLKEIGVIVRVNMNSSLPINRILKIPIEQTSIGISRKEKL